MLFFRREEVCVNPYHYEKVMKIPSGPGIIAANNESTTVG